MDIKEKEKRIRDILDAERNRPSDRLYLLKKIQQDESDYATPKSMDYGSERVDSGMSATNGVERYSINKLHKIEEMKKQANELERPSEEYDKILNFLHGEDYIIIYSYYGCGMSDEEISLERARNGLSNIVGKSVGTRRARIITRVAEHCIL